MTRLRTPRTLLALVLLPALVGGLALWSLGDRVADSDTVAAAVVNLDEPVTTGSGDQAQTVAAGRLLAAGLTSPTDQDAQLLDWQLTDAADARSGLGDGRYDAVVTIPAGFSRTIAGLSKNEPGQARFAVESVDGSGALLGLLTEQVSRVAVDQLGRRVTGTYLEGLYGQTAQLGVRLGRAAAGADRLAAGAGTVTAGADTLAGGARDLDRGVAALASGADRLRRGAGAASAGADRLTSGLGSLTRGAGELSGAVGQVADGSTRLGSGTARLAEGARAVATGQGDLASGLDELERSLQPMPQQTEQLAAGAGAVSDGVSGWARVLRGWQQVCANDPTMTRYAALCAGTEQAVGSDGGAADQLVQGAGAVASGARDLADATPRLVQGVGAAARGAHRLETATQRLAGGAGRLATGADRLADGAARAAGGAGRLAEGARSASTGAAQLSDGTARLAAGTGAVASGATRAADGADALAAGADRLAGGADRLRTGSADLAEGLDRGAAALPQLSAAEQARLARSVAAPVVADTDVAGPAEATVRGLTPAVLTLALWLGAFLVYLLRAALPPERLEAPGTPWRVALVGWVPGLACALAQAVLLLPVLVAFDVSVEHPAVLAAALLLAGASFTALVQGLVALMGRARGWATVLVLTALQALLLNGLLPIDAAPGAIRILHAVAPVPVAADLVHAGVTGSGAILGGSLLLGAWGALGLVLATRAARKASQVSVGDLRDGAAEPVLAAS